MCSDVDFCPYDAKNDQEDNLLVMIAVFMFDTFLLTNVSLALRGQVRVHVLEFPDSW